MNIAVSILVLCLSANYVLSFRSFFRGHLLGHDIPPPRDSESRAEVSTQYFSQRLDHFDPSNTNIWSQRYYVNAEYFNATEREVIFLMISGEGEASSAWMTGGAWIETATKYKALLIQLEHRFYGESHPFQNLTVENLRFLSSRQALEDTATFINGMNQAYNFTEDAKWIVFGGSYAGSLAAWLKQKYPHLVQGAMSASGPLFAQLDFPGVYKLSPPNVAVSRAEVSTDYFSQRLDHFDPLTTTVWSQRYYVNTEYFNATERETVFLMIAGEGQASIGWMTGGAWIEAAEKYGALLFELEHRFYGVSHPFEDLSTENLRFLSSRQALEDTATFINGMNQEYNLTKDAKWIVFGGSYAGSLAAWLRQKYPHLVQGAMSASGPLFAQLDFPEYLQVVADDLALYSRECVDTVKTAFTRLEELVDSPGDENITALFNLCDDIEEVNTESDIANFLEKLTDDVFAYVAQYNKNSGRTTSVDDLCDILTNDTYGDEVQRLAEVNKLFYGSTCLDYKYQNTVDYLSDVTITPSGNMRQWIYQTCSEYGWYQTSSQEEQIFGTRYPIEFFTNLCVDVYGAEFNTSYINGQIDQINTHFGGYDIDVKNVVFVHGSYDPWYPMGLTETTDPESPVIFIEGTAHCSNMYAASDNDIPQLVEAREEIIRLIGVWLGEETSGASHFTIPLLNMVLLVLGGLVINKL